MKGGITVDTLYTTKEVAARYRVPLSTVQKWIREKKITAYLLGHSYRVAESDLKTFEESRKTKT